MTRALLFDIGGTILDADAAATALMEGQKEVLREDGYAFTDEEFADIVRQVILSFVPGLQRAVVWRFTRPDAAKCNALVARAREKVPEILAKHPRRLYDGVDSVLASLSARYTLALAGNAPSSIKDDLDRLGVLRFFDHTDVSENLGISKPDTRFFQTIAERAGVAPTEAVMVGDRLDNDIIPARMVGMKTLWIRQGEYAILEPRTPQEIPDAIVSSVKGLPAAISNMDSGKG